MGILVVGLNHKTAPVEIRERLAFKDEVLPQALTSLVDREVINEGLIVSTCNRVEVITSVSGAVESGLARALDFLHRFHDLPNRIEQHLYRHNDEQAIRHVFRVAASLDSLVVGEPQILGQVKDAYTRAVEAGTIGRCLNKLMHRAFTVAKRIRTETSIGTNAVSISYVAVELAKKVFDSLSGTTVLLVGAGEMAELAMRHLQTSGANRVLVTNRTAERAENLASQLNGRAIPFDRLYDCLSEADIVIASTGASDYVVKADEVKRKLDARRHRPLFFIDIGVPRNIDPAVGQLDNVFAFDIDDLESAVQANLREREREALSAEKIIVGEANQFLATLQALDLGPTIGALKQQMNDLALAEFERNRKKLGQLSPEQEAAIKVMLTGLTNKFSHPVIKHLRQASERGNEAQLLEIYQKAYRNNSNEPSE